jgi:hypothetical protein
VSPRAEQIVNLTLSRCQRLSKVQARPYLPAKPASEKDSGSWVALPLVQIKLVIFNLVLCSSAECSFLAATAPRRHRQRPGNRLGHRPGHHGLGAAGNGLGTTIKYLRRLTSGFSGSGMVTTINYLKQLPRGQPPGHHDQVPAWRRGHRPGHHD